MGGLTPPGDRKETKTLLSKGFFKFKLVCFGVKPESLEDRAPSVKPPPKPRGGWPRGVVFQKGFEALQIDTYQKGDPPGGGVSFDQNCESLKPNRLVRSRLAVPFPSAQPCL